MHQMFNDEIGVSIVKDGNGVVRELFHHDRPFDPRGATPQEAAQAYLEAMHELLAIPADAFGFLSFPTEHMPTDETMGFRLLEEKSFFDLTTVAYQQTYFGLEVWRAGVGIHVKHNPLRVIGASSTIHTHVQVRSPDRAAVERFMGLSTSEVETVLAKLLDHDDGPDTLHSLHVDRKRLLVYQYDPTQRLRLVREHDPTSDGSFAPFSPTLLLRPVPKEIARARHHICAEIAFTFDHPQWGKLAWLALVEVQSRAVLRLRAFTDCVSGMVFTADPITLTGDSAKSTTASSATLNPCRTSVTLYGLAPPVSGQQSLVGNYVQVMDYDIPTASPPSRPVGASFDYPTRTDDFAAVNAYCHCDGFFRLVEGMGFAVSSYFDGTVFPVPIDHRGRQLTPDGIEVNAQCNGTSPPGGIAEVDFSLANTATTAQPLGIVSDRRLVLHELGGHGILYDHVSDVNFGFAHSAGDSLAAILSDPDTKAPEPGVTFPWITPARRHDRKVADGWAWGGPHDSGDQTAGDYNSEQILSTTLFRLYRAIGGDAAWPETRRFAARFTTYLVLRAVATLTPATNPSHASGFVTALLAADYADWTSEGHSGGAYGKVIRWAFEKQGLYQPAGMPKPVTGEGAPPPVDVYIDDGRNGEYGYQANHWDCQAIWNRQNPDNGPIHQNPIVGQANYAYVKLKNRGTQNATNVLVRGYHCYPGAGLVWPNDWQPMTTAQLQAPDVSANNAAEVVVGPFEWTPSQPGHECLLMIASATGDPSNADLFVAGAAIPEWRLVPHDNNIGQRNVSPEPASGGSAMVRAAFGRRRICVSNPHRRRARMQVEVWLPELLTTRGWKATFHNPGEHAFSLEPAQTKAVEIGLRAGEPFTAADVAAQTDRTIHVLALAEGILVGGMSYELDAELTWPPARSGKLKRRSK